MDENLAEPQKPDPMVEEVRGFWREVGQNMVRESVTTLDEFGRQVIAVAGILAGLYFNGVALGNLRGQMAGGRLFVFISPIVLLLLSLISALFIFLPERYKLNFLSSETSKEIFEKVAREKLTTVRVAAVFLVLGITMIAIAILFYLTSL